MTYSEITNEICARLNLTSSEATTRVGREVNIRYREVTTAPWLDIYRRARITANTVSGSAEVTFAGCEKIERVLDLTPATDVVLNEVSYDEIAGLTLVSSATPTRWAVKSATATGITIILDILANGIFSLSADVLATISDLSGLTVPAIPASFHYVLIDGVIADEHMKMEKAELAAISEKRYTDGVERLRLFCTKTGDYGMRGAKNK